MRQFGLVVLFLGLLQPPAQAQNPKVSLKVENATLAEAAAALGNAAGIAVEIPRDAGVPGAAAEPPPRATFDWTNVSFAQALRQLCSKYHLRPSRGSGAYALAPDLAPPPAVPPKRVGLVEKNGVRLYVRSVDVSINRRVDFAGGGTATDHGPRGSAYPMLWQYRGIDEPLVKAVFQLVEQDQPQRLFSFRMQDIPLPGEMPFAPPQLAGRPVAPPPPLQPGREDGDRTFYQPGGGTLANLVRIDGRPAWRALPGPLAPARWGVEANTLGRPETG
jgi:hypothetical protein